MATGRRRASSNDADTLYAQPLTPCTPCPLKCSMVLVILLALAAAAPAPAAAGFVGSGVGPANREAKGRNSDSSRSAGSVHYYAHAGSSSTDVILTSTNQLDSLVLFGDSLTDPGNFFALGYGVPNASLFFEGRFSNGPVWSDFCTAGDIHIDGHVWGDYHKGDVTDTAEDHSNGRYGNAAGSAGGFGGFDGSGASKQGDFAGNYGQSKGCKGRAADDGPSSPNLNKSYQHGDDNNDLRPIACLGRGVRVSNYAYGAAAFSRRFANGQVVAQYPRALLGLDEQVDAYLADADMAGADMADASSAEMHERHAADAAGVAHASSRHGCKGYKGSRGNKPGGGYGAADGDDGGKQRAAIIWLGNNDVGTIAIQGGDPSHAIASLITTINATLTQSIQRLAAPRSTGSGGITRFYVCNLEPIQRVPVFAANPNATAADLAGIASLVGIVNGALQGIVNGLDAAFQAPSKPCKDVTPCKDVKPTRPSQQQYQQVQTVSVQLIDTYTPILKGIVAREKAGLQAVIPCLVAREQGVSLVPSPTVISRCTDPDANYVFYDDLHFTSAFHQQVIAPTILNALRKDGLLK